MDHSDTEMKDSVCYQGNKKQDKLRITTTLRLISLVFFFNLKTKAYPKMDSTKTFMEEQWKFHNALTLLRVIAV